MNSFFDAMISRRLCRMIAALEEGSHSVVHISEHPKFVAKNNPKGNETIDTDFLRVLAEEDSGWIVLSNDSNILDTPQERAFPIKSGLTFFAFDEHWGKEVLYVQAWKLVKVWPEIVRHARSPDHKLYRARFGRQLSVEAIPKGGRARGGRFRG